MSILTTEDARLLVTELLARHCGVDPSALSGSMRVEADLGLDSIDAAELLITLRERTGRELEFESMDDLATVDAIVARLERTCSVGREDVVA